MQWRDAFCVAPHFANVTCFWDFLGVSESCVAQRIHTFCGRGSISVTCVENSWQEQQLMRYVCRRYCEQDLHRFVVLFCFRCGGGVLLLHGDKLVAKASQRHWEKMFDIATGGLMFHQFFI